jgi:hypothetical protein
MRRPRIYEMLGFMGSALFGDGDGWIRRVPRLLNYGPLAAWLSQRDLPRLPARSFRQLWRARRKAAEN